MTPRALHLDRVTITGADESISPVALAAFTYRFPFVEWGILLSRSHEGEEPRYPSRHWIERLIQTQDRFGIKHQLSGHLCGSFARELAAGVGTFDQERPTLCRAFSRYQVNLPADARIHRDLFQYAIQRLNEHARGGVIAQMNGSHDAALRELVLRTSMLHPLFDRSGGRGVLPSSWPRPMEVYSGYAGGLAPENLREQLEALSLVVPADRAIWIDVESGVRSNERFDLERVWAFLEIAEGWVRR